ncbi:MAG: ABC transporter ATP-binding protein [Eubacteriaceae bacterium]|nr:ABC transporter ATP-binding protein [Eubacteriaceae bacterium]
MLIIEDLNKSYSPKGAKAVDSLSLEVKRGEIYGFLGPNGAGKSTTIKIVAGILKRDSGLVLIDNIDSERFPIEAKKAIAYVPDTPDLPKKLKGIEYVNFIADMHDISKEARKAKTMQYAELFGIEHALSDKIGSYSHGMAQKIVLIAALVTNPRLLILDEPMVGLDPRSSFSLKELMRGMCDEGKSVFFSTHVLDVAEKFCDRIGIINNAKLVASGTMEELREQEQSPSSTLEQIFLELTENHE